MRLSVALATYNEEKNLGSCLDSVKDLADEIVIVDGGSTDKTVETGKSFGAKVIITTNPPIFHINKQKAIEACSGDWILQLDADEIVTKDLVLEIQKRIQEPGETVAYYLPRKNFFMGRWMKKGGLWPDKIIRLFKNGRGRFPCQTVHEQIVIDGKVDSLVNPLIHKPFPNLEEYLVKFNRYSDLRAKELAEEKVSLGRITLLKYLFWVPLKKFFSLYFRHKGFSDGLLGFIYAILTSFQESVAYLKYYEPLLH